LSLSLLSVSAFGVVLPSGAVVTGDEGDADVPFSGTPDDGLLMLDGCESLGLVVCELSSAFGVVLPSGAVVVAPADGADVPPWGFVLPL